MKASKVFKIGDKVKIITPEIVKRVGYPLCLDDVRGEVTQYSEKIRSFLMDVDAPWYNSKALFVIEGAIEKALAYGILSKKEFGGKERSIHVEKKLEILDSVGEIVDKKIVRTGGYTKVSFSPLPEGGGQPYLSKIKNHILLYIESYYDNFGYFWIESKNIELFNGDYEILTKKGKGFRKI